MRDWQRIAAFALLAGAVTWVADAAIDATVFRRAPFPEELILNVRTHEFYMRGLVCAGVAFAVYSVLRHRRVEQALGRKDADTQLLMDELDAFLWSATVSRAHTWEMRPLASRAFRRITGYDVEELRRATGKTIEGIVHPEDVDHKDLAGHRALAGECDDYYHEYRIRRKDGKVRWLGESARVVRRSDDGMEVVGVCLDITERRNAVEALRGEEERFRRLSEIAGEVIVIHDNGVLLETNERFFELFGYAPEEVLGKQMVELLIAPESAEEVHRKICIGSTEHYRAIGLRKDGTRFPIEIHDAPVPYKGRTVRIGAIGDMTDRVRLEEQLRQAQKMEAVGRLAGGIAHDFNNQLTVVRGYCDLLLHERTGDDPDREALLEIRSAADRAAGLTDQLLTFSRRSVIVPEVLNVNHVLAQMQNPLVRLIGEDVQFSIVTEPDLGNVEVDRSLLEQTVLNLAINARDAMPDGGRLFMETANVELTESDVRDQDGAEPGPYVMLSVSDTGKGIPENVRGRIFEPFFTTKQTGNGTGLGLSMVYGFVRQSGGVIRVESKPDEGTTFRIYLPRVFAPVSTGTLPPETDQDIPTGNETVLVAEDAETVRQFTVKSLRSCGYEVLEAANAKEAIPLGEHYEGNIDLLVTDVVMPGTSGPELAERLAAARPNLRVLYISGYTGEDGSRKATLKLGKNVLPKPFTHATLARAVRSALTGQQTQTERT